MNAPAALSRAQGGDYLNIHKAQHGGAAVSLAAAAPVGHTGVLDDSLRAYARITPLDDANAAIQGMKDQGGGGRRGRSRARGSMKKARKGLAKARKAMTKRLKTIKKRLAKLLKKMTKGRRGHRGGGGYQYTNQADYGSPGMLLSPGQEREALMGMNPEWKLAADPASFAPKLN